MLKQQQLVRQQTSQKLNEETILRHEIEKAKKEIKFSHVGSRVYSVAGTAAQSYAATPNRAMSRSNSNSGLAQSSASLNSQQSTASSSMQKLTAEPKYPSSNDVFIKPVNRKLKAGQLPKYLMERKAKWASEHLSKLHDDEIIQMGGKPGYSLMTDAERQVISDGLEMRAEEVRKELLKLPITLKSRRAQEKKADLDKQLMQIEEDLARFSGSTKIWVPQVQNEEVEVADSAVHYNVNDDGDDTTGAIAAVDSTITARISAMTFRNDHDEPVDDEERITNWIN